MKAAICTHLSGDENLMTTLIGGLHCSALEISRQNTPTAFDGNKEIQPCALLKLSTEKPNGPHSRSALFFFQLYFYQRVGYDQIELARQQVYTRLHRQSVIPTNGGCWEIRHENDVLDQEDPALQCAMIRMCFLNRG